MGASERFSELHKQVELADAEIRAAATADLAVLSARADAARKAADERTGEMFAAAGNESAEAEAHWNDVQRSWHEHVARIRERVTKKKAEHDRALAARDADRAEADAIDAIRFAAAAIEEAEYAVLDAVRTRMEADHLAEGA